MAKVFSEPAFYGDSHLQSLTRATTGAYQSAKMMSQRKRPSNTRKRLIGKQKSLLPRKERVSSGWTDCSPTLLPEHAPVRQATAPYLGSPLRFLESFI